MIKFDVQTQTRKRNKQKYIGSHITTSVRTKQRIFQRKIRCCKNRCCNLTVNIRSHDLLTAEITIQATGRQHTARQATISGP